VLTWPEIALALAKAGVDDEYIAHAIKDGVDNKDPIMIPVLESRLRYLRLIHDTIISGGKKIKPALGEEHEGILDKLEQDAAGYREDIGKQAH